jgi:hypothetical protein
MLNEKLTILEEKADFEWQWGPLLKDLIGDS